MRQQGTGRATTAVFAIVGGMALSCASATLTAAFPLQQIWPLAPVGLALFYLSLRRATMRWAFVMGMAFHLAYFLPLLWWAFFSIGTLPWSALSVAESLIMSLSAVTWVGLRGRWPLLRRPFVGALGFAVLYTGFEEVRGAWPFGGFPWGRVAFSQAASPTARLTWLGGSPLVTLAVAFAGACLAIALLSALRWPLARPLPGWDAARVRPPRRRIGAIAAACMLGVMLLPGLIPLATNPQAGELRVGAVQGNIADKSQGAETRMRGVIRNHVVGTQKLAQEVGRSNLDIVVWPENSADISPTQDGKVAAEIDQAAAAAGSPLLVGAVEYYKNGTRKNVSLLWQEGVGVIDSYAKQHPAPFAEYIPMRPFIALFSDKVNLVTSEMIPGTTPATIDVPVPRLDRTVRIADLICFEVAYDDLLRQGVGLGGQIIVVQTNNASFGLTAEGAQQFAMTRMRAIEHGRAALQISTVGLSGFVAPDGSVEQSGGLFTAEQFHAVMPLRTSHTPALYIGPVVGWVLMAAAGIGVVTILILTLRHRRRGRGV